MMVAAFNPLHLETLKRDLQGLELITDPTQVAKLSGDFHTFSPVLTHQLQGKVGDLVVRPAQEAEVMQVAAACAKARIPLTVRGAGTGNYGQCVPLQGGVILDMSRMNSVLWIKPGIVSVEAGAKLSAIDKQTREQGWELRMVPSTYRTATIGGFIAGGSGGIGSVTYGQLQDRGNIQALRVVTVEPEPRVIELRGDDVHKVRHAWGINGIMTQLEVPLAPAIPWAEVIVSFSDFMAAARFGQALGNADGILKKLISVHAWPIPSYFAALKGALPPGRHVALVMVAEPCLAPLADLVQEWGGQICYEKTAQEASRGVMLAEYTWNHTTLHARTIDPSLTYLQTLFPADPSLSLVQEMVESFGDEVMMHLEFIRVEGVVTPAALQIVRFTTEARLNEIMRYHEERGTFIANPHTFIIEDGGRKIMDPKQVTFKEEVDPYGLLNPGKMRTWAGGR
jgi:FAD/FMN-containing dehydrogenase